MKTIEQATVMTVLLVCVFLSTSSTAQTQYTYPLKPGDASVYRLTPPYQTIRHSVRAISFLSQFDFDNSGDTVYIDKLGWMSDLTPRYSYVTVNARGNITEEQVHSNFFGWQEFFPTRLTQSDSLRLTRKELLTFNVDTSLFVISRRFDTSIFSKQVHAFTMSNPHTSLTKTVADSFGLVSEEFIDNGITYSNRLSSASINGRRYNWDNRRWNFMPLCRGNTYIYKLTWVNRVQGGASFQTMQIISDTTIDAKRYFTVTGDYHSIMQGQKYVFLREDSIGILKYDQGRETLLVPSNGTVGVVGHEDIITDTATTWFFGSPRREIEYFGKWIDGIGQVSIAWYTPIGLEYDTLVYAKVCGVEYGTPTNVVLDRVHPTTASLSQNFPNPFTHSTVIRYTLSAFGHVRLEVFDMLGREVATLVDEEKEAGEHSVTFDAGKLPTGMFFYCLTTNNFRQANKILHLTHK